MDFLLLVGAGGGWFFAEVDRLLFRGCGREALQSLKRSLAGPWFGSQRLQGLVGEFVDAGVLVHEVQSLENELSELIGIVTSHEVLDNIFTNFCIGK